MKVTRLFASGLFLFVIISVATGRHSHAFAAEILYSATKSPLDQQKIEVTITVNTESQIINAVEGTLIFPEDSLVDYISDAESFVSFWVDRPMIQGNTVSFSGITPGGFVGEKGTLMQIGLSVTDLQEITINNETFSLLLHDGSGTPAEMHFKSQALQLSTMELENKIDDKLAPQDVLVTIVKLIDDKWFAVFNGRDKQSGILRFEVAESIFPSADLVNLWHEAESPYELKHQFRTHYVFVKAIDNSGNEVIVTTNPLIPVSTMFVVIIVLSCLYFLYKLIKLREKVIRDRSNQKPL